MKIIQNMGFFAMIGEEVKPYVIDVEKVSEKYRKALEEIRGIIKNYDIPNSCEKQNCKECEICIPYGLGIIINKINEVLDD